MEKAPTLPVPNEPSKRHAECLKVLTEELAKSALHFRQELTEADVAIYYEALKESDPVSLREALQCCRNTMQFMPKISDVRACYSEPMKSVPVKNRTSIREWFEPYGRDKRVHYFEYSNGARYVTLENLPMEGERA